MNDLGNTGEPMNIGIAIGMTIMFLSTFYFLNEQDGLILVNMSGIFTLLSWIALWVDRNEEINK